MNTLEKVVDGGNFTIFNRMGEEKRVRHIDIVRYIEHLASSTGVSITNWDILEVFGKDRGNELYLERREINRRFFNKYREEQNQTDHAAFTIEAQVQERLNDATRQLVAAQVEQAKSRYDRFLRDARNFYQRWQDQLAQAFEQEQLIAGISRRVPDIGSQIKTIIQEGFWEFNALTNDDLILTTRNDVVMKHVNRSAGVDIQVNLGKFKAVYDLRRGNVAVKIHSNNINVNTRHGTGEGLCHPHVDHGNICWGRSGGTASRLMSTCELPELFRLLANLMMDYNEENPYASLYRFHEHKTYILASNRWATGNFSSEDIVKLMLDAKVDPLRYHGDDSIGFNVNNLPDIIQKLKEASNVTES